jgi:hypothetical protein
MFSVVECLRKEGLTSIVPASRQTRTRPESLGRSYEMAYRRKDRRGSVKTGDELGGSRIWKCRETLFGRYSSNFDLSVKFLRFKSRFQ